jgi:hypothetical protein
MFFLFFMPLKRKIMARFFRFLKTVNKNEQTTGRFVLCTFNLFPVVIE